MTRLRELDIQSIVMPVLTLMVGTAFFHYARPIIVPLIIAAALTYVLLPLVDLLKRLRIPHALAVVIVMLVVVGIVEQVREASLGLDAHPETVCSANCHCS